MLNSSLDTVFKALYQAKIISTEFLPSYIESNLTLRYQLRDYQRKAIRYLSYYDLEYECRIRPSHLLFQMATGSGKTLVMAASMLYFYTRGYRRFLFCSNREVIIAKTRDNLLNRASLKYLFQKEGISIDGHRVDLNEVSVFGRENSGDRMEIILSTVQKLHLDLCKPKENSLSEEELRDQKMVILADEAHHLQVISKSKTIENEAWEGTINRILSANKDNYLLELTATMDLGRTSIKEKYRDKQLLSYPLKTYREEGYSKEIYCIASGASPRLQMLQALLLSQYRQALLSAEEVFVKPVILFKSRKISPTKSRGQLFGEHLGYTEEDCIFAEGAYHYFTEVFLPSLEPQIFEELSVFWRRVKDIEEENRLSILEQALAYFEAQSGGIASFIKSLQQAFTTENCRLVHSKRKK